MISTGASRRRSGQAIPIDKRWPNHRVKYKSCGNDKVYTVATKFNWVCKSRKESLNKETGEVLTCGDYRYGLLLSGLFMPWTLTAEWCLVGSLVPACAIWS